MTIPGGYARSSSHRKQKKMERGHTILYKDIHWRPKNWHKAVTFKVAQHHLTQHSHSEDQAFIWGLLGAA